jgi:hypothetical protein
VYHLCIAHDVVNVGMGVYQGETILS